MRLGILLALASAVLFGASTPFAKLLLGTVDPWLMAGLLYPGAGLGLAVVHVSRGMFGLPAIEAPLRQPDVPWLALVILFGGVFGPLLLMLGLARTDATSGSLLLNLEGLVTMGIAWVVFRENVDRRLMLGAFAILAGASVLSSQGEASFQWSGLLIAGACLCWGIDNNLTRKLSSADPVANEISLAPDSGDELVHHDTMHPGPEICPGFEPLICRQGFSGHFLNEIVGSGAVLSHP